MYLRCTATTRQLAPMDCLCRLMKRRTVRGAPAPAPAIHRGRTIHSPLWHVDTAVSVRISVRLTSGIALQPRVLYHADMRVLRRKPPAHASRLGVFTVRPPKRPTMRQCDADREGTRQRNSCRDGTLYDLLFFPQSTFTRLQPSYMNPFDTEHVGKQQVPYIVQ